MSIRPPAYSSNVEADPIVVLPISHKSAFMQAVAKLKFMKVPKSDDAMREAAMEKWKAILFSDLSASSTGRQMVSALEGKSPYATSSVILADTLASKATRTLNKRSSSLLRFGVWLKSTGRGPILPFKGNVCYEYINYLKLTAAPTSPSSFLSAANFAFGMLGADGGQRLQLLRGSQEQHSQPT